MLSEHRQRLPHTMYTRLHQLFAWHSDAMLPRWRHPLVGYLVGLLLVALGLGVGLLETQLLFPFSFPGVLLLFAVVIVAFLWGAVPALFTVLLSLLVLDYLYVPPFGALGSYGWSGILQLLTFAGGGIIIAVLTQQREAARVRALAAERKAVLHANQLEATFEAISDGVVVYGRQGQVLQTNAATRRLFGLSFLPEKERARESQALLLQAAQRDDLGELLPEKRQPLSRLLRGEVLTGSKATDVLVRTPDGRMIVLNMTEEDHVSPVASVGFTPQQEQQWRKRLAMSPSLANYVGSELAELKDDMVLLLDGMAVPMYTHVLPYYVQTVLCAPICVGERLIGLLCVDNGSREHSYSRHEITLLQTITRLAALVLARAQLQRAHAEARANELALREANHRMEQFLGIICHELKTPLTIMKGSLQLAERKVKRLVSAELPRARLDVLVHLASRLPRRDAMNPYIRFLPGGRVNDAHQLPFG